ncbi:MAG: hypothetical protein AAF799_10720 [Myxococcota bacterium]
MKRSALDSLIAAEREEPPAPAPGVAKQNWQRLKRSMAAGAVAPFDVPPPPTPSGGAALLKTVVSKALMGATFAGAAIALVLVLDPADDQAGSGAVASDAEQGETARPEARASASPSSDVDEVPAPAVAPANTDAVTPEPAPMDDAPEAEAEAGTAAVPEPRAPGRARKERRPEASASEGKRPTGIAREIELIKWAGQAVNRGEHRNALSIVATHRREFPRGALTEDREALHAIAKCGLDVKSGARTAASFSSRFPRSVHEQRVAEACSIE